LDPLKVNIEPSWREALADEFRSPYFDQIKQHLLNEKKHGHEVYPPGPNIFKAFELAPIEKVNEFFSS